MSLQIRVLHVDDDPEFTSLVADFIGRDHDYFEFVEATNAREGTKLLAEDAIDCVVSDYKLPEMNGIEFLETVREEYPDLPFILFTGKGSETVASEAISTGATDYFRKERVKDQYELLANRIENAVTASADRQRAEIQEREYRTLVDSAPVPMVVINKDRDIAYVNGSAVDTLAGDSAKDIVGEQMVTFLPEETVSETTFRLDHVIESLEPVETREFKFVDLDGNVKYGQGTIVPVTFDGETAAQAVVSDITERKEQERRVEQKRRQIENLHGVGVELSNCETDTEVYELMVEAAENILDLDLCVVDSVSDGQVRVEATSSDLTEYREAPLEDAGVAGLAYRTGDSFVINDQDEHPEANPAGEYQSAVTVPIGEFGVFQAAAYERGAFDEKDRELVEILAGHVREALVRVEQEQTLREQRDQLQRENERLDEFASIISHDLRNPINVARLRLDLAMKECDSEHLDAVDRSVDRMETLTSELLALARMGEEVTEHEPVDLESVTDSCWHNVDTADATLVAATDATIMADSNRMQQVLENLFSNAIEHAGEDVTVTVGTDDDGFYVADDGEGMSDEVRERALESGFSRSEGGTGFGLAIVARIAEAHGWELEVTESETGGVRFDFSGVEFAPDEGDSQ